MTRILTLILTITLLTSWLNSTPQSNLVIFPSLEIEFIIGPQVKSGMSQIAGAQWFDQTAISRGLTLCSEFPDVVHTPGNVLIAGTVSVIKGSKIVTGAGTRFTTETKDYAIIQNGANSRIVKIIGSVQSDTQLTLSLAWEDDTLAGQSMSSPSATEVDSYQGYQNYYDFVHVSYTNYYRTGDQRFLDCARKAADSWWSQPVIDYGKQAVENSLAPRSVGLNGLMLRALDGHPEMWPWITAYVREGFAIWVSNMTGNTTSDRATYPGFYFGIRDGGFMLLYAANLAKVHPDATVREEFRVKALHGAVNYYARLQQADGSYRWNDDDFPFSGIEQPFMVGILNEGMIAVHRLTNDSVVKSAILKSVEHEYAKSYNRTWGAMYYFVHGTIGAGTDLRNCEAGCGNAANPYPPADLSWIDEARQLNATAIHQFGYAYAISGDTRFVQWGDEIFNKTYSGQDGHRGLANARGKEFDESYRSAGRYLAWRGGVVSGPLPTPSASPVASPIATPMPTISPTPMPVPTVLPTPAPTPSTCTMTVSSPTIPQWSSGKLVVTFTGLTQPGTVKATATSGQVAVDQTPKSISGTSVIAEFWLQVKKKSSAITVEGPCGQRSVMVNVR